jgi:hypothetical protein
MPSAALDTLLQLNLSFSLKCRTNLFLCTYGAAEVASFQNLAPSKLRQDPGFSEAVKAGPIPLSAC